MGTHLAEPVSHLAEPMLALSDWMLPDHKMVRVHLVPYSTGNIRSFLTKVYGCVDLGSIYLANFLFQLLRYQTRQGYLRFLDIEVSNPINA